MADKTHEPPEKLPADAHAQEMPPPQYSDHDLKQLRPYDSSGFHTQYEQLSRRAGFSTPPLLLQLPDDAPVHEASMALSGVTNDGIPYLALKDGFSPAIALAVIAPELWYLKNPDPAPAIEISAATAQNDAPQHPLHHSVSKLDLSALKHLTGGHDVATNDAPNHPKDGSKPNGRIIT